MEARNREVIKWKPPKPSYLKINFDSSVINQNVVAGFIILDDRGCPIVAGTKCLGENTISVAEAMDSEMLSLRHAIKICVRSDSSLVTDAVTGRVEFLGNQEYNFGHQECDGELGSTSLGKLI